MLVSREDVDHVARLARLEISDDEAETLRAQLSKILTHAERVTSLDTEDVQPTSHAIGLSNVLRPDDVALSLPVDEALANAPLAESGHFRVPRILDLP